MHKCLIILSFVFLISGCSKNGSGNFQGQVTIEKVIKNTSVTIKNGSNQSVNLGGWKLVEIRQIISSPDDTNIYVIPSGVLAKGADITYSTSTARLVLGADETLYLYDNTAKLASQMYWMFFTP